MVARRTFEPGFATHPVRRVEAVADHGLAPDRWPATIPAVAQVLADGLDRGPGAPRWGFFLRAETMHGWYTYLESLPPRPSGRPSPSDPAFHEMSHGESFLAVLAARFDGRGFYCLDEPEAALSFSSTLGLISALHRVVADRGQVLCATHSPVLAAMPGARILEAGPWGLRETRWEDLELVDHWRRYLSAPQAYLRHLTDD